MSYDAEAPPKVLALPLGALISVRELERSISFYEEIFGLDVHIRDDQVAVLGLKGSGTAFVTLRQASRSSSHPGLDAVGARALFWNVGSIISLNSIEATLRHRNSFLQRLHRAGDTEIVVGFDPDRLALGFAASHGSGLSIDQLVQVPGLAYAIDQ